MKIIYEDNDIIVVVKPHNVATQSAQIGARDLESELKNYRKSKGEQSVIYVVHRLDQPVGGLLVFAKNQESAADLSRQLSKDSFSKEYIAVVYGGKDIPQSGTFEDYLEKDNKASRAVIKDCETALARKAILSYEVIESNESETKLYVHLKTGRFHQIRAQLSYHGMPIIGDLKYGSEESVMYSTEKKISRVCLDAVRLSFTHPKTKEKMEFEWKEDNV